MLCYVMLCYMKNLEVSTKNAQRVGIRQASSAADLGMFSMFGRTGAPTKRGPHKGSGEFYASRKYRIMGDSPELTRVLSKKGRQFFRGKNR